MILMKTIFFLFTSLLWLFFNGNHKSGTARIQGTVTNADELFITINYNPLLRGNPSFDGYKSTGSPVSKAGNFAMDLTNITDRSQYSLVFGGHGISFPLFMDDEINVTFDSRNLRHTFFATGKGAGKINVVQLEQFKPPVYRQGDTPAGFAVYRDSTIAAQRLLLENIFNLRADSKLISAMKNKSEIEKIIMQTPLSRAEYLYLDNIIGMNRFMLPGGSDDTIDFQSDVLISFKVEEYRKISNINYVFNQEKILTILQVEYAREMNKQGGAVTYSALGSLMGSPEGFHWMLSFLKNNFSPGIHDKISAELLVWAMTLGSFDEKQYNTFKAACADETYIRYIDDFREKLLTLPNVATSNRDSAQKVLDAKGFDKLIEDYKKQNALVVFWSAQFAGASVINDLPVIRHFSETYGLKVLYICVDEGKHRQLWSSKVMMEDWKGKHYFLPLEGNHNMLKKFSDKNIDSFCFGGAAYAILRKDGSIYGNIESPIDLAERLKNVFKR